MNNLRSAKRSAVILSFVAGLALPMTVAGHHGANSSPALYLAENMVELDGEVSGILWRNPHPRLMMTVVGDGGAEAEWELEFSGSVNGWERSGVDAEFFRVGDTVRAAGFVSRRDPRSIGLLHLLLPSGEEMVSGNRALLWSDERFATATGRRTFDPEEIAAAEAAADGIFRVWGQRTSGRPRPDEYAGSLTEHGRELAAQYHGPTDNPELECRTGIPTHMFDPTPMEVSDGGDRIFEVDETYMGGKRANMSNAKRKQLADEGAGRGSVGKVAVVGVQDRATKQVRAQVVESTDKPTLQGSTPRRMSRSTRTRHRPTRGCPSSTVRSSTRSRNLSGVRSTPMGWSHSGRCSSGRTRGRSTSSHRSTFSGTSTSSLGATTCASPTPST